MPDAHAGLDGITVARADPREPACAALLAQSHAMLASMYPPEQNHYLGIDALAAPDIRFLAARVGQDVMGTGAIALRGDHTEVKSMFTAPEARGRGVADAILRALIALAAAENRPLMRLETGPGLDAAHRLYARHGFRPCGPFGTYVDSPGSLFFERLP